MKALVCASMSMMDVRCHACETLVDRLGSNESRLFQSNVLLGFLGFFPADVGNLGFVGCWAVSPLLPRVVTWTLTLSHLINLTHPECSRIVRLCCECATVSGQVQVIDLMLLSRCSVLVVIFTYLNTVQLFIVTYKKRTFEMNIRKINYHQVLNARPS